MDFTQQLKNYLNEVVSLVKEHYIALLIFISATVILKFVVIPFLSLLLMIVLMFYLSKTKDYRHGNWKIFNVGLFFILLVIFIMIFTFATAVFMMGHNVSSLEEIVNSSMIRYTSAVAAYATLLFIFAPYRILDANVNVFAALKYSFSVIINNFLMFIVLVLFFSVLNFAVSGVSVLEVFVYILSVAMTAALYRLNVNNTPENEEIVNQENNNNGSQIIK